MSPPDDEFPVKQGGDRRAVRNDLKSHMAKKTLLMNVDVGETRVALIEDGIVAELYVERARERSPVGNIYLGKVTRVLPGMQAAFIDVGLERAAFLHVEDLVPADAEELADGEKRNDGKHQRVDRNTPISDVLSEGQQLMVQVNKGPISTKGARVTSHVALPGRYVVFAPRVDRVGISKRIGNDQERKRLKEVIESVKPEEGGIIIRTLAEGLTKKQLQADIDYLVRTWKETERKREDQKEAPAELYSELDIVRRAARDLFDDEVDKIIVDDPSQFHTLRGFLETFLPHRAQDVELYEGVEPLFDEYGVEDEIARALSRKVPLKSGGHLIIDQAEALTAIDVNTGRFTGKGRNVKDTILQTNMEAVEEIAYQLRFRNIGGLIVLDFIDMDRSSHRDKVNRALAKVLKRDKAKTTTVRISELGLVEMTRKRTHESLGRTLYEPCFYCDGTGVLQSKSTICQEIFRQIRREKDSLPGYKIVVHAHPAVCDMMDREEAESLGETAALFQRRIELAPHREYHLEQFHLSGA